MSHNFLIISDPQVYRNRFGDVPNFYRHLAQDSRINLFHCNTHLVLIRPLESPTVWATEVKDDLLYEEFINLNNLASNPHSLAEFDLAFCRSLKPFVDGYLERLSDWERQLLFVNSPSHKIEQIGADFLLKVAQDWIPETVVTKDYATAFNF